MATTVASSEDESQSKSPTISFINSQNGKQLLIANEYIFKLNKTTTTILFYIFIYVLFQLSYVSINVHNETYFS
ncbi:unnamed protein product, partial [Rotaria magnacalcarata]